ncbi:hypothetical protein [Streptomyces aureus]|uniref:hypothetical protein n=1 Tax=Streptomyces aureus TaxID=193461 RepID=UPI00055A67BB|nr:hypothetical protein [Streptomyces aureus]
MSGAHYPSARTLWTLAGNGVSTTLSGAGSANSGSINITDVADLWLAVYVAGTSTGTTPTLDVQIDVQDPAGNWFAQVAKTVQLTSSPNFTNTSCGLHIGGLGSMVLPNICRVVWTVGGTNPVFPQAAISLIGR